MLASRLSEFLHHCAIRIRRYAFRQIPHSTFPIRHLR